jgi:hypothetical protein
MTADSWPPSSQSPKKGARANAPQIDKDGKSDGDSRPPQQVKEPPPRREVTAPPTLRPKYKPFLNEVDLLEAEDVPPLVRAWRHALLDFHDIAYAPYRFVSNIFSFKAVINSFLQDRPTIQAEGPAVHAAR